MKNTKITEVKFVLSSEKALGKKFELSDEIKDVFKVTEGGKQMKIWYLDTSSQALNKEAWSVRYRFFEGKDFELTYKKRFTENDYKTLEQNNGLKSFKGFKLEIDKRFSRSAYSLSYIKHFPMTVEFEDLNSKTAKNISVDCAPKVFLDWKKRNFGLQKLDQSLLYGPIYALHFIGRFEKTDVTFEVWKFEDYFVEISADVKNDESEDFHFKLLQELQKEHFVLPVNTLKTEALFEFFSKHPELI